VSRSNSLLRIGGSMLVLVLSGAPAVPAQTLPIRDYVWVKAFMRAAFPELAAHGNLVEVSFDDHFDSEALPPRVRVTVRGPAPAKAEGGVQPVLVSGTFASPPDSAFGDSAEFDTPEGDDTRRLRSVSEEAAHHPEWTDEDLVKALHRVGAEYPLDRREAFLRQLDVTRFAPFLGAIQHVQVEFIWRRPEAPEIVMIGWRVRLETAAPWGSVTRYILFFEPMHGRLRNVLTDQ